MPNLVSDISALRRWSKLDKEIQNKLLANAFCANCFVTTIVNYEIISDKIGVVLRGKCKQCGRDVARMVEEEWFHN